MNRKLYLMAVACLAPTFLFAQTIVDDSWADGGRTNGADPLDTDWWTTSSSSAIEVSVGSLGLVTGTSGRGIRATFAPQTLAVGQTLTATYTFATPATVGTNRSTGLRVGLYDKLGKAGLEADLSASSGTPNPIYDDLPGYMSDFDVTTGTENIGIRKHDLLATTGRLLGTTSGYTSLGSGGAAYTFLANTTYVGVFSVTRTGADSMDITSSLSQGGSLLSTYTDTDASGIANNFGMLAFHVNSNTFGTSNTAGIADNGIDFSNVLVEVVPEPSTYAFLLGGLALGFVLLRRRR